MPMTRKVGQAGRLNSRLSSLRSRIVHQFSLSTTVSLQSSLGFDCVSSSVTVSGSQDLKMPDRLEIIDQGAGAPSSCAWCPQMIIFTRPVVRSTSRPKAPKLEVTRSGAFCF
jgi:hypothetical protein